ncbi:hypothetical protein RRF57_004671 [Xylaria bambusicola]|uniref:Uncharacterized protein n=1 Tax=Xylaria bambusicola TaxID=326684 RepID=A0AAN7Z8T9_9PEZI
MTPKTEPSFFVTSLPESASGQSSGSTTTTDSDDSTFDALVQTKIVPLTTIFTPPAYCQNRFYVTETEPDSDGFYHITNIYSYTDDPLYRSCQPDPDAFLNSYSPAVCPYNMDIATVTSWTFDSTNGDGWVWYQDLCCQRHVSQLKAKNCS